MAQDMDQCQVARDIGSQKRRRLFEWQRNFKSVRKDSDKRIALVRLLVN